MKKILAAVLLLCTLLAFAACANKDQTPDGMKDAAIENADYHLYVPEVWIESNTLGLSGAHVGAADQAYSPNVIVTVYYPDTTMDVATYFTTVVKPQLELTLDALTMVTEGTAATLGGKNAWIYTYTYTLGGTAYKQMQVIAANGYRMYTLTYTATANLYDAYIAEVDSVVAAFTFK